MAAAPRLIDTDLHNDLAGPRELLPFFTQRVASAMAGTRNRRRRKILECRRLYTERR